MNSKLAHIVFNNTDLYWANNNFILCYILMTSASFGSSDKGFWFCGKHSSGIAKAALLKMF